MEFHRVPAIDGVLLRDTKKNQEIVQRSKYILGRPLKDGEIGCYLSHIACLEKFLMSGDEYCLVLEDDFSIIPEHEDIFIKLVRTVEQGKSLTTAFNVINLAKKNKRFYSESSSATLRLAHNFPFLTTGLIWSREGALLFIDKCSNISRPVDIEIQCFIARYGGGLTLDKAIFNNDKFPSIIDKNDNRDSNNNRRYKMRRLQRQLLFAFSGLFRLMMFQMKID